MEKSTCFLKKAQAICEQPWKDFRKPGILREMEIAVFPEKQHVLILTALDNI